MAIWLLYALAIDYKCENDFQLVFKGSTTEVMCTQAYFIHTMY